LSLLLPYSVFLCVVPLPDSTNSINAAKGGKSKGINLMAKSEYAKTYFVNQSMQKHIL
jgi:hypothetical protein